MLSLTELLDENDSEFIEGEDSGSKAVPYPQANSLDVVLSVICSLRDAGMSVYDLVGTGIVNSSRQARYYYNAAAFLGFCYRRGDYFYPTDSATSLMAEEASDRAPMFAAMILRHEEVGRLFLNVFMLRDREARIKWISEQIAPNIVAVATLRRRASCLLAWMSWVQENLPKAGE